MKNNTGGFLLVVIRIGDRVMLALYRSAFVFDFYELAHGISNELGYWTITLDVVLVLRYI